MLKNRHRYKDLSNKKFCEIVALPQQKKRSEGTVCMENAYVRVEMK